MTGHAVHASALMMALYFPAPHAVHDEAGPVYPALQRHADTDLLAAGEKLLLGQEAQEIVGP